MKEFKLKPSIVYDCSLNELNHYCQGKVLVVCDPFFMENGTIEKVKYSLRSATSIEVYSNVKPDPTLDSVIDGVSVCKNFNPDTMIAIGGGSAIDLAKAIMYFDKESDNSKEYKLIVIPTTSGTGSEVTSFAVISDTANKKKIPIISDKLLPDIAFLDNEFVEKLPQSIVAYTGMDALTHCLEAYVSTDANVYSDSFALQSLQLIRDNLLESYKNSKDDARINMHQAATIAGIAFNEASLGINHAIAHQLGALFKIPHGQCNAILLPSIIKFNAQDPTTRSKYNKLAYDLHLTTSLSQTGYRQLIMWVNKFKGQFKIENKLSELKIDKKEFLENIDLIASNALEDRCMATNPIQINHEQMVEIVRGLY